MLRLPGSVEEIDASPEGPEIGAFFDFDGTLIAGYSASHFSRHRFRTRDVTAGELIGTIGLAVNAARGRGGFEDLLKIGAAAWKGRAHADLEAMGERVFEESIADIVYPEARALVMAHRQRGHTVVLSSSATEYQAEPVARHLGIDHVLCNRYGRRDGVLTGEVESPVIWGQTKAMVVQTFARANRVELSRSYFYADGDEDTALMYLVGHPRPTNPGKKLARVAAARGWPILRFTSRSSKRSGPAVKQFASGVTLAAATAGAATIGVVRRDRRAGVDFAAPRWLDTLFAINGVTLRVIGRENLERPRPAVFVFNHRSDIDGLIAARLIKREYASLADRKFAMDPISRTVAGLADITFVDWTDASDRTIALERLQHHASHGRSVLLAPERVSVNTPTVGAFHEDAFRIAIATRTPIVPIVIRNAEMIAGPSATVMVEGVVDVAVLPAIPVQEWSDETIDDHVAAVRQVFLDTLAAWPSP